MDNRPLGSEVRSSALCPVSRVSPVHRNCGRSPARPDGPVSTNPRSSRASPGSSVDRCLIPKCRAILPPRRCALLLRIHCASSPSPARRRCCFGGLRKYRTTKKSPSSGRAPWCSAQTSPLQRCSLWRSPALPSACCRCGVMAITRRSRSRRTVVGRCVYSSCSSSACTSHLSCRFSRQLDIGCRCFRICSCRRPMPSVGSVRGRGWGSGGSLGRAGGRGRNAFCRLHQRL